MCPTNSTTTTMLASSTTTTTLTREKEEEGGRKEKVEKEKEGRKKGGEKLLDKDWGARIPDYISRSLLSILVFIMGLTMKVFFLIFIFMFS